VTHDTAIGGSKLDNRGRRRIMQQGKPSVTSLRVAISRAIHQLVDQPTVVTDPAAVRLVEAAAPGAIEAGIGTFSPPEQKVSRAVMALRSRFAEDELA
jgi:O-methyltransferase involved in polyketide biosynthesis